MYLSAHFFYPDCGVISVKKYPWIFFLITIEKKDPWIFLFIHNSTIPKSSGPRDKTKTNNKDNRETFLVARLHHITNLHEDFLGLPANCETKRKYEIRRKLTNV